MSVAGWLPVARLDPADDSVAALAAGSPRQQAAITTPEVSPPVLTRAQCPTCQPSRNGRRLTGRQPPTAPGARRQTAAHARETNTVTSVAPGAGLTATAGHRAAAARLSAATGALASLALSRSST